MFFKELAAQQGDHERRLTYMARRRFFVDEVRSGRAKIEGDAAHHLTRVLRVERGQQFEISDNETVYLAEIESARKDLVSFAVLEKLQAIEPSVHVSVYAALIRFERFELLIEKATEMGVEAIVPVEAERSEKGLERAAVKRLERWRRIAREASEQSRRTRLPEIGEPVPFEEALRAGSGLRLALDELSDGAVPLLRALPDEKKAAEEVALLVGPEGGWTEGERARFEETSWIRVSLGPEILKTETAAIAALAVLKAAWDAAGENRSEVKQQNT